MLAHPGLHLVAARQAEGFIALLAQVVAQHLGDLVLVLDDQDARRGLRLRRRHACPAGDSGRRMSQLNPPSAECPGCMRPPCALTMACTMARPRPLPPLELEREASTRNNRSVSRPRIRSAHARRGVLPQDAGLVADGGEADIQPRGRIAIAQRVLQQIAEHLRQAVGIGLDHEAAVHRQRDAEPGFLDGGAACRQCVLDGFGEIERRLAVVQGAQIRKRQHPEVFDQARQPLHFLRHGGDARLRERAHAVLHGLDLRAQRGQRRAQFMGDVGDPLLPAALRGFQRLGQVIEITASRASSSWPRTLMRVP